MSQTPLFSIITVTYNAAAVLPATLQSVAEQTCKEYEYIVVDGASTDNTLELVHRSGMSPRIICERDKGIYDAMNKGMKIARGTYLIFMNAGDTFADSHVLSNIALYADDEKYDVLYGDIFTTKNGELKLKTASEPCNKQRMYFCHQAAFVKTSILKATPFNTKFKMSADLFFFKHCRLLGYHFLHVPVTVAVYDSRGISNTQRIKGLQENIRIVKELDKGWDRIRFLCKLYYVVFWIKLTKRGH